jgi:hypothetical protein
MHVAQQIKTETVVVHPIVAALVAAEQVLGPRRNWQTDNTTGRDFFAGAFARAHDEAAKIPELEHIASFDADAISNFLTQGGFSEIKLDPFAENEFGVAAILKLILDWKVAGTQDQVFTREGKMFPSVQMSSENVEIIGIEGHEHPGISIPTTSGDEVFLVMTGEGLGKIINLREIGHCVVEEAHKKQSIGKKYELINFPMVDLDVEPDISWLVGSFTRSDRGQRATIMQALMRTMLAMDHLGAIVKSSAAMRILTECMPSTLIIDKPFYTVINRPGLNEPIFTGLIGEEHWKQPVRNA